MPLGMAVGLGPGDFVLDGNPAPPGGSGTAPPNFRPMSIVAKRSPISATAELLLFLVCCSLFFSVYGSARMIKLTICELLTNYAIRFVLYRIVLGKWRPILTNDLAKLVADCASAATISCYTIYYTVSQKNKALQYCP